VALERTPRAARQGAQLCITLGKALKKLVAALGEKLGERWNLARVFNLRLPGSGDSMVRI
jgi:hypothetical protein